MIKVSVLAGVAVHKISEAETNIMGDILDVISSRKSIRRYTEDPIPDEILDKILEAARWAPSGENEQPWKLIVVRDSETRRKIGEIARIGTDSA